MHPIGTEAMFAASTQCSGQSDKSLTQATWKIDLRHLDGRTKSHLAEAGRSCIRALTLPSGPGHDG